MGQSFTIAGAHLKVYINGQLLGITSGMSWENEQVLGELHEIDNGMAKSLTPRVYRVGGTFKVLRGRFTGGLEGVGVAAYAEQMLRQKYMTIELLDRVSDDIVFRATSCKCGKQSWTVDAKGLVTGTFNWQGIRFGNEGRK